MRLVRFKKSKIIKKPLFYRVKLFHFWRFLCLKILKIASKSQVPKVQFVKMEVEAGGNLKIKYMELTKREEALQELKSHCRNCSAPIYQKLNGGGGYEVGLQKWFQGIEPWPTIIQLCKSCFQKVISNIDLSDYDKECIEEQKAKQRVTPERVAL